VPAEDVTSAFKSNIIRDIVSLLLRDDGLQSIKLSTSIIP
jgi:hypothetical protein